MKKIVVLSTGMVGSAIAIDLASQYDVIVADINEDNLRELSKKHSIKTHISDLSIKENVLKLIENCDLVVGAVPGFMGFETLKTVIEASKDIVDISFFPEDAFLLDEPAKEKGVTAIVDCGVAPGMSNVILGYHNANMEVEKFKCYVGGLPVQRMLPFQYKAPFSPIDVIEEYIRPARFMENGKVVTKPALSEPELINFDEIGTLEAFNTDGLRSLLKTMKIPNMKEKTMRYPGHIDYMKMLRETGFFQTEDINVNGIKIKPINLTSKLLFSKWKLGKNELEFTVMKIKVAGKETGKFITYEYDLLDRYDKKTGTSSMARTTGYTCTAAVKLVLDGDFTRKGISPPEFIGAEKGCFKKMLDYQKERGIVYRVSKT
ncbi:MAG: saccharopine dehydrogenase NADP-binding domain-containing protein [Candidatus Cloacimonetes bacterium]|nr:saccharopine dehydrogenase NADP-binding domain-containing protein [Candidatus Cloacimonadota bacterium]